MVNILKIDSQNVQISRAAFIQLVKYFGAAAPDQDPEQEERRQFILQELFEKTNRLKKREEYKKQHLKLP